MSYIDLKKIVVVKRATCMKLSKYCVVVGIAEETIYTVYKKTGNVLAVQFL